VIHNVADLDLDPRHRQLPLPQGGKLLPAKHVQRLQGRLLVGGQIQRPANGHMKRRPHGLLVRALVERRLAESGDDGVAAVQQGHELRVRRDAVVGRRVARHAQDEERAVRVRGPVPREAPGAHGEGAEGRAPELGRHLLEERVLLAGRQGDGPREADVQRQRGAEVAAEEAVQLDLLLGLRDDVL
jgi:hypothetical protein